MSKKLDAMGDRMKGYEMLEAGRKAMPGLPLLVRLDGRAFHTFTRGMQRPFDPSFCSCMLLTTEALVEEFHASIGYTQSDEITLLFPKPEALFDGRYQKLTSVTAGYASAVFARYAATSLPAKKDQVPCFDSRAWQVPTREEALNAFIWREDDAVKNSITMAASALYSHKALMNKNSADKHEMLHAKGVNWNSYPAHFKRGAYLQRRNHLRTMTDAERERIPAKHRPPAGFQVERSAVEVLTLPPLRKLDPVVATALVFGEWDMTKESS